MIQIHNRFTDLEEFRMFSVSMFDGATANMGPFCKDRGQLLSEDLWYEKSKYRRGEAIDTVGVSRIPEDMTPTARSKRCQALEKLYAVLIPLELSPFPEPKESESLI